MSDLVGKIISKRYRVESFLGKGGMAEVYKVWDQERNVNIAMKVLYADLAEDRVFLRRFKREAQTLAKLQHPNIVRFYGMEQDEDLVYMLMDYVEGATLRKEIFQADAPLSFERIQNVMKSACSALYYAHKSGFVHCDIKPANIMSKPNGDVLIADFGISRMTEASTVTMVGAGTPAYMSPEQIKGEAPIPQMDIYSLGIVLFEMLTGGERPFTGENAKVTGGTSEKIRWEQMRLPAPPPSQYNSSIPSGLDKVVLKCLDKSPKSRYLSAMDLYGDLILPDNALARQEPVNDSAPETTEYTVTPHRIYETPQIIKTRKIMLIFVFVGIILLTTVFAVGKYTLSYMQDVRATGTAEAYIILSTMTQQMQSVHSTATALAFKKMATNTPVPTPTPSTDEGPDGMTLIYVPAGEFTMGTDADAAMTECQKENNECSRDGFTNELPHSVYLDSFWIDQTEVTNAMYAKCVADSGCRMPGSTNSADHSSYYGNPEFNDYPVIHVNWNMANEYCSWAGRRLPTEAEWEKAARGTDGRIYPWGNELPNDEFLSYMNFGALLNPNGSSILVGGTTKVGSYEKGKSPYGAYDMAGNVMEWVSDWYSETYYQNSPSSNPLGPDSGKGRVARGGDFLMGNVRSADRNWMDPAKKTYLYVGFRCARDASP